MSCEEAFRVIAGSCIRQIIANKPGMCAGHAEALHQLRVGLRRLRAVLPSPRSLAAPYRPDNSRVQDREPLALRACACVHNRRGALERPWCSLSIHHLPTEQKRSLFPSIRAAAVWPGLPLGVVRVITLRRARNFSFRQLALPLPPAQSHYACSRAERGLSTRP
jgi:hypothetical protein